MKFKGFPTEGIAFLRELKKHNDREWFTPKLDEYKRLVREPMVELVHSLHVEMLRFAPAYVGEPAKCVYRVYRDTRFSKNKTPYKTSTEALFWHNRLDKNSGGGFFLSISPEHVAVSIRLNRQHCWRCAGKSRPTRRPSVPRSNRKPSVV